MFRFGRVSLKFVGTGCLTSQQGLSLVSLFIKKTIKSMAWSLFQKFIFMFMFSSYFPYNYIHVALLVSVIRTRLSLVLTCPLARFNIPLSRIRTVAYEVDFRPRQLAHILQYTDFFAYITVAGQF